MIAFLERITENSILSQTEDTISQVSISSVSYKLLFPPYKSIGYKHDLAPPPTHSQ